MDWLSGTNEVDASPVPKPKVNRRAKGYGRMTSNKENECANSMDFASLATDKSSGWAGSSESWPFEGVNKNDTALTSLDDEDDALRPTTTTAAKTKASSRATRASQRTQRKGNSKKAATAAATAAVTTTTTAAKRLTKTKKVPVKKSKKAAAKRGVLGASVDTAKSSIMSALSSPDSPTHRRTLSKKRGVCGTPVELLDGASISPLQGEEANTPFGGE